MAASHEVFLSWAGPVGAQDPRAAVGRSGASGAPNGGAAGAGWAEFLSAGPDGALNYIRDGLPRPDRPRRLVVNGGDAPELVAGVDAGLRRPGDELVLAPPDVDGRPDPDAVALALDGAPPGRGLVVQSAVTPTGAVSALPEIAALCTRRRAPLVLDLTLARWTPLPLRHIRPAAVLAALDRWEDAVPGVWGAARGSVPNLHASKPPTALLDLDAALRRRLAEIPLVAVWPMSAADRAVGVIAFAVSGWGAEEVAELLSSAFGIAVEAGRMTAAPLPAPLRLGAGFLRASLSSGSTAQDIEALAAAVSRLAASRISSDRTH